LAYQAAWPQPDLSDIVENNTNFDAAWYRTRFADVDAAGLDPMRHFLRYGQWLNRGVSAAQPGGGDIAALLGALRARRVVSYCIPIMNRRDDIATTLPVNLAANRPFADNVEFVVVFLDRDAAAQDWARKEFAADIATGYLRVITASPLPFWHFGRAKNAFRGRILGDIYSSVDGDNFVTPEETQLLFDLHARYGDRFILHHFSGKWGDGSSGRVSVPRIVYEEIGYDERFLPRQFDEIDLIISVLVRKVNVRLVRYESENHLFSPPVCRAFAAARPRLSREPVIVAAPRRVDPLNPRGADYINDNALLKAMLAFNQACSLWKNAADSQRAAYIGDVFKARHAVIDAIPRETILPTIISPVGSAPLPVVQPEEICVFSSIRNDETYLPQFYKHYRKIGVQHFFLIDDNSTIPVSEVLRKKDVHVFRPEAGIFATGKGMWLEALMKVFLRPGMWALTVDADEFLDLPPGHTSLASVVAQAEQDGEEFVPAILVDMLPSLPVDELVGKGFEFLYAKLRDHACAAPSPNAEYTAHHSVKWGFAEFASISWALDARYHAFRTFDSLRKLPLIRYRPGMHLNQGFHDLHYTDGTKSLGTRVWRQRNILPLRHYKTAKIFDDQLFELTRQYGQLSRAEYHHRTVGNIGAIFGREQRQALDALAKVPKRRYSAPTLVELIERLRESASAARTPHGKR
jgi:hypothetical protein